MNQIKAEVIISIPSTHALIEKVELERLEQQANPEWVSGLKWLSEQTGIKTPQKLKDGLLYLYRDELEEFVDYPETNSGVWRFNAVPMKEWLRNNFHKVVK